MKICFLSYEYEPFPGGGIATYHNVAVKKLVEAGHEVHVVTNAARHGSADPSHTQRRWQDGSLHIHRLDCFDEDRRIPPSANFLDVVPSRYGDTGVHTWATHSSNYTAFVAAQYIESLHARVGLDVIESPEFYAETFYILRRRASGERHRFPPVCIHGHVSSRIGFSACGSLWNLGYFQHRHMMNREDYCIQQADALLTPSRALMGRYEAEHGEHLPAIRDTMPYFLEIPEALPEVPARLRGMKYLVTLGRIEPRKGSVDALRAFAKLASDHSDLHLVYLGGENWHPGEKFDDVITAEVEARHRDRVIRLGNVPRDEAIAITKGAAAFLHPALWDNYPCAVMEAMGAGAACVVSDQGGQAEMIEDGDSGLVVPAGDIEALTAAIRKVLDDASLAAKLREGAMRRIAKLTDTEQLVARKIAMYESICVQEVEAAKGGKRFHDLPLHLQSAPQAPKLPGQGLVVIDAGGASEESIKTTCISVQEEIGSSPEWRVAVLADRDQNIDAPSSWPRFDANSTPPWLDADADAHVVYVLAGTRFDFGKMGALVSQLVGSRNPCGSFLWLRPANVHVFPYIADVSGTELVTGGRTLPPAFAVRAQHLADCNSLIGLYDPQHRLCALMAAASLGHELTFRHTGTVCGDFYGDLPFVQPEAQHLAMGYLDLLGLLPSGICAVGNTEIPMTPNADIETRIAAAAAGVASEDYVAPVLRSDRVTPEQLAGLQRAAAELEALKQMKVVRMMRGMGAFGFARKLFPKSKKMIGSGD